jgi:hypothetical protein
MADEKEHDEPATGAERREQDPRKPSSLPGPNRFPQTRVGEALAPGTVPDEDREKREEQEDEED